MDTIKGTNQCLLLNRDEHHKGYMEGEPGLEEVLHNPEEDVADQVVDIGQEEDTDLEEDNHRVAEEDNQEVDTGLEEDNQDIADKYQDEVGNQQR